METNLTPCLKWAGVSLMLLIWLYTAARLVTKAVVKTLDERKERHG